MACDEVDLVVETVRPGSAEELRQVVQASLAETQPLELIGRGTKRALGRPVEADLLISLERLSGVELYEPEELVMSAGVGTPIAEIERLLIDNQQELAFEPADYGLILGGEARQGTIGGVFACNLCGPRRLKAGAARDHFLGLQAVTGRGDLVKSGGRVMKNVTGYDLAKLMAGSFGTLAAMTSVTFKVLPAAETTATLLILGLSRSAAMAALRQAVGSAYEVAGAAFVPEEVVRHSSVDRISGTGRSAACLRLEGTAPSVDYRIGKLRELLGDDGAELDTLEEEHSRTLWREIRDVNLLPDDRTLWRISLPPAATPDVLDRLEHHIDFVWLVDWAGGLLWLATNDDGAAGPVREGLADAGGHATLIRASETLRLAVPPFQPEPGPLAALTARVKRSFDPEGILNRGRMFESI
jgi:glycolate oxidase FAD binding subunit